MTFILSQKSSPQPPNNKENYIFCNNKTHSILLLLYRLTGSFYKTKIQYTLLMSLFFLHLETFYYNILGIISS